MDKFMSYTNRGLRGTAVHEYREAASAHNKHYDTGDKHEGHVHPGRFLLKAQPQQGKTGTIFLHCVQLRSHGHALTLSISHKGTERS